jgi:hypothetical protein
LNHDRTFSFARKALNAADHGNCSPEYLNHVTAVAQAVFDILPRRRVLFSVYDNYSESNISAKPQTCAQVLRTKYESTRALQSCARCYTGAELGDYELCQSGDDGHRRDALGL